VIYILKDTIDANYVVVVAADVVSAVVVAV